MKTTSSNSDDVHEEGIKNLIKEVKGKVSYLESHSRRNSVVLLGLEEGFPGDRPWQRVGSDPISHPGPVLDGHLRSL